jgi:hypothetical protein
VELGGAPERCWMGWLILACVEPTPQPSCDDRRAWYPDADADGLGERTAIYVGCDPPAGWVLVPEPAGGSGSDTGP